MKQKLQKIKKMKCSICLSDDCQLFTDKNCKCQFCFDCVLNWIEEKINLKQQVNSISCLNHKCKQIISLENFQLSITNKQIEEKYMDIMLKNYFQQTHDIRPCPNNKCSYYAFLPTNRCGKEFSCQQCNFNWLDKQYLSYDKLFLLKLKDIKSDIFTSVFEFISTQECPRCNSKILKNGGCSHMTCKKCQFYYCWSCNNQLNDQVHSEKLCLIRVLSYLSMILLNIAVTFYNLGWLQYIFMAIWYPLYGLGLSLLYNSYIILPITIIATLVYTYKQWQQVTAVRKQRFIKSQAITLIVQIIISILLAIATYYNIFNINFNQALNYHYYQFIIIMSGGSIVLVVLLFNNFFYQNWLKFLI
ncbi:unnamed protein product (macronuclear) [Paramecium tetraurelia]|uniref:RING-type domain-containing protein n=1 Tax=Paramecium tetraurelia TaxID=5888 RepID=A0CF39_PARTE|nr:uncharacterized protein GSPATT00037845001 [Paramecium tetraurelia]CAK69406.1 unnamed protein product [Paramecium tetraurelia]|eukprot:XP_001436803.1 hypothetical protein (macronuclear) [Paramecium tetraurelia strain d4-2]